MKYPNKVIKINLDNSKLAEKLDNLTRKMEQYEAAARYLTIRVRELREAYDDLPDEVKKSIKMIELPYLYSEKDGGIDDGTAVATHVEGETNV